MHFRLYLSLAVLLPAFCHAETLEPSHHGNTTVHGLNDGTRCSWNCTDIDSYLMEEMKTIIATNEIIRLVVKYEVMDKCVDQTSGNSSGYTEHWQIWGCLENTDLENADLRPQTSKTQTSKPQTSKTQTSKTQTTTDFNY